MNILVIDENPEHLKFLSSLLSHEGYRVQSLMKGKLISESLKLDIPELIIINNNLRDMDIRICCQRIKEQVKPQIIPILMINEISPVMSISDLFSCGIEDYFSYPFSSEEIIARVKQQATIKTLKNSLEKQNYLLQVERNKRKELEDSLTQVNQELENFSPIDPITKLASRHRFDDYLDQEWRRCARERVALGDVTQTALSLILCEMDDYSLYEATYGTVASHACLYALAQIINHTVKRPSDLVATFNPKNPAVFAILLPNTNIEGAFQVATHIRAELEKLQLPHDRSTVSSVITLSMGIATAIPTQALSTEVLVNETEQALVQAKEQGKDIIVSSWGYNYL